ncbi:hypothetical protein HK100_005513 [Physocladia obscura]|uniref:BZIP domain-containing protein n=1 Tax=Physocladia obscura TaxID=109957 RepID=A0AAD5SX88_9FUNG|nr:hypothetical protein HK100_005513 [Physocladia obscura]
METTKRNRDNDNGYSTFSRTGEILGSISESSSAKESSATESSDRISDGNIIAATATADTNASAYFAKKKPGRKLKHATIDPLDTRAESVNNLAHQIERARRNQRAYRERKATQLQTLHSEVATLKEQVGREERLRTELEAENQMLKLMSFAFSFANPMPTMQPIPTNLAEVTSAAVQDFTFTNLSLNQPASMQKQIQKQNHPIADPSLSLYQSTSSYPQNMVEKFNNTIAGTTPAIVTATVDVEPAYQQPSTQPRIEENDNELLEFLLTTENLPFVTEYPQSQFQQRQQKQQLQQLKQNKSSSPLPENVATVMAILKSVPSLKTVPNIVDELSDWFAMITVNGLTPDELKEKSPEKHQQIEELKDTLISVAKGEDKSIVVHILGRCNNANADLATF